MIQYLYLKTTKFWRSVKLLKENNQYVLDGISIGNL